MPAIIIDDDYLSTYAGSVDVIDLYSKASSSVRDSAIATATAMIRSAALNDYTAQSFDALTLETSPKDLQFTCARLAIGIMTDLDSARPDQISNGWIEAKKELGYMSGGKSNYVPPLVKHEDGSGAVHSSGAPPRVFNPSSTWDPVWQIPPNGRRCR